MELSPVIQKFVLHWGEMGTRWGVNRTVAQVHALLYLSPKALNAEEIAETLSIARSNVSTSIRELQNWGLISSVPVLGDRRTHYEALSDVWRMFQIVLEQRKQREIDPTAAFLRECVQELDERIFVTDEHAARRLREMLEFFEAATSMYEEVQTLSLSTLRTLVKSGARVKELLGRVG